MNLVSIRTLLALFLLSASLYAASEARVVIMHTNDIRGHVLAGPDAAGSARLATVVHQMKPDLMLDAGEMFSGDLISDIFLGAPVIQRALETLSMDDVDVAPDIDWDVARSRVDAVDRSAKDR